jgi:hypothetical protein
MRVSQSRSPSSAPARCTRANTKSSGVPPASSTWLAAVHNKNGKERPHDQARHDAERACRGRQEGPRVRPAFKSARRAARDAVRLAGLPKRAPTEADRPRLPSQPARVLAGQTDIYGMTHGFRVPLEEAEPDE